MLKLYCSTHARLTQWFAEHRRRDERGLSQSTENAILLAGAAAIALIIISVITQYVQSNLPK